MEAKVRATVTLTDDDMPEGFDQGGNAWRVTLRYRGKQLTTPFYTGSMAGEPTAASVLESLILDASCTESSFEEWCADFGYDTDSRRAYSIFMACKATAVKLEKFLGYELNAALSDHEAWVRANTEDE